jgi:transcriptional regulator with XRE-family HTH domain
MTTDQRKGRRAIETGPTGMTTAKNLAMLRKRRGLTTRQLSAALERAGRPIPASGITRMEKGERAVTVDDLAALATVLDVSPAALMLPAEDSGPVHITPAKPVPWLVAWRWAHGEHPPFTPGGADDPRGDRDWPERRRRFLQENQPYRDPDHLREVTRYIAARIDGPWHLELDSTGDSEHGTLSLRSERTRRDDREMSLEDQVHAIANTYGISLPEARSRVYARLAEERSQQEEKGRD